MEPSFISLGGFNKNLEFKKMRYFNVDTIAGQWKYHSFMDFIQGIFLTGLKRQLMLSGKTLPCQDIHFIKGRCTRLSGWILFTVQHARLKWLYGNFIITDIRPSKNTINILLIQLGWIFCRRHSYICLTKEEEKRLTPLLKLSIYQ